MLIVLYLEVSTQNSEEQTNKVYCIESDQKYDGAIKFLLIIFRSFFMRAYKQ